MKYLICELFGSAKVEIDNRGGGVILTTTTAQSVRLVVALSEARGTLSC